MAPLHIKQIATVIKRDYAPHIDLDDVAGRPENERQTFLLTRGLAALAVRHVTGCGVEEAAASIIDGFGDTVSTPLPSTRRGCK